MTPQKSTPIRAEPALRKATTFRLEPPVQAGLVMLGQVLKMPLNRLVNEAVRGYVGQRCAALESDLEEALVLLREYRKADPTFNRAAAEFIDAEARHGADDPLEGSPVPTRIGPTQAMLHRLLRG